MGGGVNFFSGFEAFFDSLSHSVHFENTHMGRRTLLLPFTTNGRKWGKWGGKNSVPWSTQANKISRHRWRPSWLFLIAHRCCGLGPRDPQIFCTLLTFNGSSQPKCSFGALLASGHGSPLGGPRSGGPIDKGTCRRWGLKGGFAPNLTPEDHCVAKMRGIAMTKVAFGQMAKGVCTSAATYGDLRGPQKGGSGYP